MPDLAWWGPALTKIATLHCNLAQGCKVVQPRGYIWENTGLRKVAKTASATLRNLIRAQPHSQPCATLSATSRNLIGNLIRNLIRNLAGTVATSFATLQ